MEELSGKLAGTVPSSSSVQSHWEIVEDTIMTEVWAHSTESH